MNFLKPIVARVRKIARTYRDLKIADLDAKIIANRETITALESLRDGAINRREFSKLEDKITSLVGDRVDMILKRAVLRAKRDLDNMHE